MLRMIRLGLDRLGQVRLANMYLIEASKELNQRPQCRPLHLPP